MKKIIKGKIYNTETAEKLFNVDNGLGHRDFNFYDFDVYKTKRGAYFIAGEGGPMTQFSIPVGNMFRGGSKLIPITIEEAMNYAESNISADKMEEIFKDNIVEG